MKKVRAWLIVTLALGILVTPLAADAQRVLRYEGRVQWIAGSTMILATDDGWSMRIDLTRVPVSEYSGLRQRDRIAVSGMASQDRNYVIGLSIERSQGGDQAP